MENKLELFHADLFIKNEVGTTEQREKLLNQIIKARQDDKEAIKLSNDGCWRSYAEYTDMEWLYSAVKETVQNASEYYFDIDKVFVDNVVEKNLKVNYWTNINNPGAANTLHTHNKDSFAAVYYLQATGTGAVNFLNPANLTLECSNLSPFTRGVCVEPRDGDLLVWPGWVPHEVLPNPSDRQRINIAFSINVK